MFFNIFFNLIPHNFLCFNNNYMRHSCYNDLLLLDCILPGYYGDNCSTPCPENCVDGLCDNVNGTCYYCRGGYSGPTCNAGYLHFFKKFNLFIKFCLFWFLCPSRKFQSYAELYLNYLML